MPRPDARPICLTLALLAAAPAAAQDPAATRPPAAPVHAAPAPRRSLDLAVRVSAGTLGVGAEVAKLVASHLAVRAGAHGFSYTRSQEYDGVQYDARARLRSASVLVDLYPAGRGSFHVTGGALFGGSEVSGTGAPGESVSLNGSTYAADEVGTLRGAVAFPRVRPYAGIGWGTPANTGTSVRLVTDFGIAFGRPTVTLGASNPAANEALSADIEAQRAATQRDADKYLRLYPVMTTGLSLRF